MFVFLFFDFMVSWGALFRQNFRHRGYEPITFIGRFLDQYYGDEVLKKYYTNMKVIEVSK